LSLILGCPSPSFLPPFLTAGSPWTFSTLKAALFVSLTLSLSHSVAVPHSPRPSFHDDVRAAVTTLRPLRIFLTSTSTSTLKHQHHHYNSNDETAAPTSYDSPILRNLHSNTGKFAQALFAPSKIPPSFLLPTPPVLNKFRGFKSSNLSFIQLCRSHGGTCICALDMPRTFATRHAFELLRLGG
jgi:hypothetical protein